MIRTNRTIAITLALAVFLMGISFAAEEKAEVTVEKFQFTPATLEVKLGTTVTWTNKDAKDHTVQSGTPDKPDQAGPIRGNLTAAGGTYSCTFAKAGEYPYFCDIHHKMTGKIVVK
jgi:plastocyanin